MVGYSQINDKNGRQIQLQGVIFTAEALFLSPLKFSGRLKRMGWKHKNCEWSQRGSLIVYFEIVFFLGSFIHRERSTSKSACKRMPSIVPRRFNTAVYLKRMHEGIEAGSRHVDTLIPVGLNDPWMITSWNTEKTVAWCLPFRLCSIPIFLPTWDSRGDYFAYTTTVEALKQL